MLDTNVLVSALVFSGGKLEWLRRAWKDGTLVPLLSRETGEELLRVLHYPKFQLSTDERDELLADFLPFCETFSGESDAADLSFCRDVNDRMFLRLALAVQADAVVSGDADLTELANRFPIPILTPAQLRERVDSGSF